MKINRGLFCSLAILSLVTSSCVSTTLTSEWKDETYLFWPEKKIFIVGAFSGEVVRKMFEEEFVRQLTAQGTEAVASCTVLAFDVVPKQEVVLSLIKEQRADAVIITRYLGKTSTAPVPPAGISCDPPQLSDIWQDYYTQGYSVMPAYTQERDVYRLETALYDAGTEKLVWKTVSETTVEKEIMPEYKLIIALMIKKLQIEKLIQ